MQAQQQDGALGEHCHREGGQIETTLSYLEAIFSGTQLGPLVGQCICWGLGFSSWFLLDGPFSGEKLLKQPISFQAQVLEVPGASATLRMAG